MAGRRYTVTRLQRANWHGEDRRRRALAHSDDLSQLGSRDVCVYIREYAKDAYQV